MKKHILSVVFLFVCGMASAQVFPAMNVTSDPVSLSLGGTSDRNAAVFALEGKKLDAGVSYMSWSPKMVGTTMFNLDALGKIGPVAVDFKFRSFGEQPYSIVDANGFSKETFTPSESIIGGSVAYVIADMISVGAGISSVSVKLGAEYSGSAVAADVYAAFAKDGLRVAVTASGLGGKIDLGGAEKQSLPSLVRLDGSYELKFGLKLKAEADYLFNGGIMGGAGAEYDIAGIASVRAGYHFGDISKAIPSYAAVGAGVHLFGAELNFAYLLASETIGDSLIAGLRYSF